MKCFIIEFKSRGVARTFPFYESLVGPKSSFSSRLDLLDRVVLWPDSETRNSLDSHQIDCLLEYVANTIFCLRGRSWLEFRLAYNESFEYFPGTSGVPAHFSVVLVPGGNLQDLGEVKLCLPCNGVPVSVFCK